MKKLLLTLLMLTVIPVFAKTADSKNYYISADSMMMVSLAALNNLHYTIVEMQSSSGYILFQTQSGYEYLLMITKTGATNSNVKIMKVKKAAPLFEIQQAVFNAITQESSNLPSEVK